MFFSHLVGNDCIKEQLESMTAKGTVGQSLLFSGPDGIGKGLFAYALAKTVLCQDDPNDSNSQKIDRRTHPDIRIYRPEGKMGMHTVQSMHEFTHEVYLPPHDERAGKKFFIIHDAHRMLPYSANALLKTLEEPAASSVIILLSSSPYAMLPTILSRCRRLYFSPIAHEEITTFLQTQHHIAMPEAKALALRAKGSINSALQLLHKQSQEEDTAVLLLDMLALGCGQSYQELTSVVGVLDDAINAIKKQIEEKAKEELLPAGSNERSAVERQALEKEVEGAVSMRYLQEVGHLLEAVLGWYRDMELLSIQGDRRYLVHVNYEEQLVQALQRGELRPLEEVQAAVAAMRLAIERSTSFSTACETLVLKLLHR